MALDESAKPGETRGVQPRAPSVRRPAPRLASRLDGARFEGASRRGLTRSQAIVVVAVVLTALILGVTTPELGFEMLCLTGIAIFALSAGFRLLAALTPQLRPAPPAAQLIELPVYSVILPMFREAGVVDELVQSMCALDYPADRLQVILTLEADDAETIAAVRAVQLPDFCEVLIAGPGSPRTKPRACNLALEIARGEFIVIYDAEDRPDPGQLREAVARFADGPPELACLQAPLRIEASRSFIGRQFALEYAVQFEVLLPAMARMGMAFPLGGTSNHFRTDILRDIGGWDPHNVTEDADLGFRMSANGWRMATLSLPTWETPPQTLLEWLPQRTRWQKGHLQTLGVHTRRWRDMRRHLGSLLVTLVSGSVCALVHGPVMAFTIAMALIALTEQVWPPIDPVTAVLLLGGWVAAAAAAIAALRRTGRPINLADILAQPLYWPLQSLAMAHAIVRLIREPFAWDKTPHAARQAGRPALPPLSADNDRSHDRRRTARPSLAAVE